MQRYGVPVAKKPKLVARKPPRKGTSAKKPARAPSANARTVPVSRSRARTVPDRTHIERSAVRPGALLTVAEIKRFADAWLGGASRFRIARRADGAITISGAPREWNGDEWSRGGAIQHTFDVLVGHRGNYDVEFGEGDDRDKLIVRRRDAPESVERMAARPEARGIRRAQAAMDALLAIYPNKHMDYWTAEQIQFDPAGYASDSAIALRSLSHRGVLNAGVPADLFYAAEDALAAMGATLHSFKQKKPARPNNPGLRRRRPGL